MDGGVWRCLHLLEYREGGLMGGTQLQHVPQVKRRLLEVTVCLQYLPELQQIQF